jgi:hypothetical protein
MKKINKSTLSALLIIFGFFVMSLNFGDNPDTFQPIITEDDGETNESLPNTSQFIPRTIRVAIYDEPNITAPSYAVAGGPSLNNNYTGLLQLLQGAGYQVDELTCDDIYNHKLMTADYDVFVMVDNLPKVNITDYVKEFWLGGGALLSFDSAIAYLCYYGILMSESVGDQGRYTYYDYTASTPNNISSRHPTTQDYQVNDKYSCVFTNAYLYWDILLTTSVGGMVTKLANTDGHNNWATAVALERDDKGGRIVQLPGRTNVIGTNMSDLIIDSIEWLCPRPKGRIVFDLSHQPRLGVDDWDSSHLYPDFYYYTWRNNLVSRSYTFDKLYPSASGNFTLDRLSKYDLLVVVLPDSNYSTSEINVISNWVNNGGSLLVMGERTHPVYLDGNKRINLLLTDFNLEMNLTYEELDTINAYANQHPTIEGCADLQMDWRGGINISGDAYALWEYGGNIHVACQDTGNGRIILVADMNWITDLQIANQDNRQFGINAVNWLTSDDAKILLFTNNPLNPNYYVNPVAQALNELKLPFALTFTDTYLNLSLYKYNWDLVIVNQPEYAMNYDILINYVDSGRRLIMETFQVDDYPSHPLWAKLGFSLAANLPSDSPIYLWNPSHSIFTTPAPYGANNFTQVLSFGDQGDLLTVYPNATALAGFTNTTETGNASIVLRNDGRTLFNGFLIDQFIGDTDDSTYDDCFELWVNEIAFMLYQSLSVGISSPHTSDIFNATAPDFIITTDGISLDDTWYTLNDGAEYHISSTSGKLNQGAWDGLPDGFVSLKFYVEDSIGQKKYTSVNIVKDSQAPNITIILPSASDIFNTTAPNFIVEIVDEHLDKMWYTINSGSTKYFFTANGSIDQPAWDVLTDGLITIRIYANDTVSNEAFATVSVDLSTLVNGEIPGGIPGYNAYILIGVIFVISAIIVKRQLKQNKFKN